MLITELMQYNSDNIRLMVTQHLFCNVLVIFKLNFQILSCLAT